MGVKVESFGVTSSGEQVNQYILENEKGVQAVLLNYGAVLSKLLVPDRNGGLLDVVWGYDTMENYEKNPPCFGATIGRNANRIGKAQAEINGTLYLLEKNNGENNLHSGTSRFHRRLWEAEVKGNNGVTFSLCSPDGDQGFPGNAQIEVTYTLTEENELQISYEAKADQDTIFNMTNHSYFNLEGQASESVLEHQVMIAADAFTASGADLVPTGELEETKGTPMDFREFRSIGSQIEADYEPLRLAGGYDHNFVLHNEGKYSLCAVMKAPKSGVKMEVYTDLPGLQFYTANGLEDPNGKGGRTYQKYSAACFETQYFPDAVHHENFQSTIVKAGEVYHTTTGYKFSVETE